LPTRQPKSGKTKIAHHLLKYRKSRHLKPGKNLLHPPRNKLGRERSEVVDKIPYHRKEGSHQKGRERVKKEANNRETGNVKKN
jgi:hypothetical protein